jgi:hypothetical protein
VEDAFHGAELNEWGGAKIERSANNHRAEQAARIDADARSAESRIPITGVILC